MGYSTLAEVYHARVPFGYIKRARFKESEILSQYITRHMAGCSIDEKIFETGDWIMRVPELLNLPAVPVEEPNGADQTADFILKAIRCFLKSAIRNPKSEILYPLDYIKVKGV